MRISRPSCANSRIPPRHARPPPPSFATLFLTSPPDQCTPAGAVDNGSKSTAHCTFARFHSARGRRARRPYLTSRGKRTSLNQRDDTRRRVASRCTQSQKNKHVTRYSSRIALFFPLLSSGYHYHSPIHPQSIPCPSQSHGLPFTGPKPVNMNTPRDRLMYARRITKSKFFGKKNNWFQCTNCHEANNIFVLIMITIIR